MIYKAIVLGFLLFCTEAFSQDFDAELVSQKTFIEIKNGKLVKDLSFSIKINNRRGEKYTKVLVPYSKMIKVGKLQASVKDQFGKVVKTLKNSDVVDKSYISNISFYEDDFIKEFTLKHNSYPYTLVYSYQTQQSEFIYIDFWHPVLNASVPTLFAELTVTVPNHYSIFYKNQFVDKPDINTLPSKIEYRWKTAYAEVVKAENYAPSTTNFLPSVAIVPGEFKFDKKGSLSDWTAFGNWQYNLLQGLNDLPVQEKNRIDRLIEKVKDEKEKIRILYHFLQDETRYINVAIETGGLKPYPASYVAKNKYGDCKALTNYFKSVLEYAQIPSYYTKVNAGANIDEVDRSFPSQQFNHIILYIPLSGEEIWLDCTSDNAFNYLGTFTQGRDAFVIDQDKSRLVVTPALTPEQVLESRTIEFQYKSDSPIAKFTNTYRGDLYENLSYIDRNFSGSDKLRVIRDYMIDDGFQLIDYEIQNPHRDSIFLQMTYEATAPHIYKHYGNDILIKNVSFKLPPIEKPGERKLPVQIDYPVYKKDTIVYEIPEGFKFQANPDPYKIANKYGSYEIMLIEDSGKLSITKSLLINKGRYPVSEYKEFYNFYLQIIELENKMHALSHKS